MVLILRTSNRNRRSHGGFRWPESGHVEAPDWDPEPVCGGGLHGLANGRGNPGYLDTRKSAIWQVVAVEDDLIVDLGDKVKFPQGEVTYSGDREGALAIFAGGKGGIREWICQDARWAFFYALYVDMGPRDDTRSTACKDAVQALRYALYVDGEPRDDTRAAACKDPMYAYRYAHHVDKEPRDDTRTGACRDPYLAFRYASCVDEGPHEDTRAGACKAPMYAFWYAADVDRKPHEDTRAGACKHPEQAYAYATAVDRGPHEDTRMAVKGVAYWRERYALFNEGRKKG